MTYSVVHIPSRLQGATLSYVARGLADGSRSLPPQVDFDFSGLRFIDPCGVTFLSNLVHWLASQGCRVMFTGINVQTPAICYLDDSLFFEQHVGRRQRAYARPRETTRPLIKIAHQETRGWVDQWLLPWLADSIGLPEPSFHGLRACIMEIFNNIQDHATKDTGSVFVQHFPNLEKIHIAISDFGVGIPATVRRKRPELSDTQAVVQAVQDGFTTRSKPTNMGAGLSYLLSTVVGGHGGSVTFYTLRTIVGFRPDIGHYALPEASVGFCPGTTIEIQLPTKSIQRVNEGREDLEW